MASAGLTLGFVFAGLSMTGTEPEREPESPGAATSWPRYELRSDAWWLLSHPERRMDASALLRLPSGEFWTVNDQAVGVYRIHLGSSTNAELTRVPHLFTREQCSALLETPFPTARLDCEGMAIDDKGRIYFCEESRRWILRWEPGTAEISRLQIDWAPVRQFFHPTDANASFEGIAVGRGHLYVANERQSGRIIVIDLESLKIVDHFVVAPSETIGSDINYSDLCWADDSLWVLMRDVRKILRVDPEAKRVLAEFDYSAMETRREVAYGPFFAPGFMEGLWVDDTHFWLLCDNNGFGRRVNTKDSRPTLFRAPRPDRDKP